MNYVQYFRWLHQDQKRKYTGDPYSDHLAEVAGIAASAHLEHYPRLDKYLAVCWGHDSIEDQEATLEDLTHHFGLTVATGIGWLSDTEEGNRAQRKDATRERLAKAPDWVQTIKCADILSNTGSIVIHDPSFAKVYLEEVSTLLKVLRGAEAELHAYVTCEVDKCR